MEILTDAVSLSVPHGSTFRLAAYPFTAFHVTLIRPAVGSNPDNELSCGLLKLPEQASSIMRKQRDFHPRLDYNAPQPRWFPLRETIDRD